MKTEIEVKILDVDVSNFKEKLKKINAKFISEKFQRRFVYDFNPKRQNSWIRLRDTGEKIELTIKEILDDSVVGTKELEVMVSDFNVANEILKKLGYKTRAYQENKRISYLYNDVQIEIDFWPEIPPYVEIEAKSLEDIKKVLGLLGYNMEDTTSINTKKVYKHYGLNIDEMPNLCFKEVN